MPRLGELLILAGLLTAEQIEQALRAQVLWGGRLGTNLVELHHLELDPLAKALGRQHRMPAALARHFDHADRELQRRLSPELAERYACVPLLCTGPDHHIVVASVAPIPPRHLAIIADELAVDAGRVVPAIAAELRIRYQLERVYGIRRAARFLRARGKDVPLFPALAIPPAHADGDAELDAMLPDVPTATDRLARLPADPAAGDRMATELALPRPARPPDETGDETDEEIELGDDDLLPIEVVPPPPGAEIDPAQHGAGRGPRRDAGVDDPGARERRTYVRTLADAPSLDSESQRLGRIMIRRVVVSSELRVLTGATLGEATRAIRRGTGRDRVADLVIDTIDRFVPACEAAILLVIRGTTAVGWKGFQRTGTGLGEIAVPMDQGGLIPRAVDHNAAQRGRCSELDAIDRLLLTSLGRTTGDLVIVPIAIADRVMCVIALAADDDATLASTEPIAAAAGAAFARLMRDAGR